MGQFEKPDRAIRKAVALSFVRMPERSIKRPRDVNSLAARLVAESVGDEKVTLRPPRISGTRTPPRWHWDGLVGRRAAGRGPRS